MVSRIKKIKTYETYSEINSLILEANLIKKYKPEFNVKLTDDKSYPKIKITIKDKYPKILISRKEDDKNAIYFGPYPNATALRFVLKTVRKIFPFQSVLNHQKKVCLYHHLGLCPCPEVLKDKNYKSGSVKQVIRFLKGQNSKIIKDLEKERNRLSKNEEFEKALIIQKKIDSINLIVNPSYTMFDYETNPNLSDDLRNYEINELLNLLNLHKLNLKKLERIECYDISNMGRESTVGSMVVFINGYSSKNDYRKFKIKGIYAKQDDFFSLSEIINRRLNHTEWTYPDLIIVDGGKGQVSSAKKILKNKKIEIPIIGIAKRYETVILPNLQEINLNNDSKALLLLKRIRDEAHRFAITYHKKIRGISFLTK